MSSSKFPAAGSAADGACPATGGTAGDPALADEKLRYFKQSFRLLFDSNPVPMWLMDIESLALIAVNDAAIKHYGYSREKFLSMNATDLRLAEDRDNFNRYLWSGANSQGRAIWRHQKADGGIILVSVYSGDLSYGGRAARLCAVVDVTERKRAEDELREQKSRSDTAMNNMSQGVLMFDAEGRLMLYNRRYIEMYNLSSEVVKPGCTLRELIEHRVKAGLFYDDQEKYERELRAAMAEGKITNRIIELQDGRTIHAVNHPLADGGWVATHEDITERKHAQARLAKEANENRRLFETSLDLILVTDRYGNIERVSPISAAILGYAPEEMTGRNAIEFIYPGDLESTREEMRLARRGRHMRNFETRYRHKDGHVLTLAWSGVWSEPEQKHFFTGRDVTERNLVENKLKHLAHYDQLTGLANRVTLQDDIKNALSPAGGAGPGTAAIAIFDLDGFKDINDTLGHTVGDRLLQSVAQRMTDAAPGVRFYRLGGDEFVMVDLGHADLLEITRLTEIVLKRLGEKFEISGHQLFIGASAGIAIAPGDGDNVEELISSADLALYDAKAAGGNVYRLFMPVLRAKAQARRELEAELRRACSNREFELYFQPQVRSDTGEVVGAEALLRWRHPVKGILAPGAFIEALSDSPVAIEVGRWILQSACETAAGWRSSGLFTGRIGVNLFPAQFHSEALLHDIEAALNASGLPATALEIEITEDIALGYEEATLEALRTLRAKGISLSFDDFGTGYASLSYLARYPLTRIKIDQSFVRNIAEGSRPEDTAIVRSIIVMAHNLGLAVIAEGVETAAQEAFLRAEKCEELQGYFFARPLSMEKFAEFLRADAKDKRSEPLAPGPSLTPSRRRAAPPAA